MKPRILFICHEYPPNPHGGIGVFVKNLAEDLAKKGCEVAVTGFDLINKRDQILEENAVKIFYFKNPFKDLKKKNKLPFNFKLILERWHFHKKLKSVERKFQPNIIESFEWSGPLLFKPKAFLIIRLHGSNYLNNSVNNKKSNPLIKFFEKRNLAFADKIVSISDFTLKETEKLFKIRFPKPVIIPNSIDLSQFSYSENIDNKPLVLGYIGRIHPLKGIDNLLRVFECLTENNPEYKLIIAGKFKEKYRLKLEESLNEDTIKKINWLGNISHNEVSDLLKSFDAFLMPTKAEAFGLSIIESMASGCLVFANPVGSIPFLIKDGHSGFLIDYNDPLEASSLIDEHLKSDPNKLKKIKNQARAFILEKFDDKKIVMDNLLLYQNCISKVKSYDVG